MVKKLKNTFAKHTAIEYDEAGFLLFIPGYKKVSSKYWILLRLCTGQPGLDVCPS